MGGYPVSIIVVSDSVSKGESHDRVVESVKDVLSKHKLFQQSINDLLVKIVPDEIDLIKETVSSIVDGRGGLVLTSGGTGFATRDRTPEALNMLIDKPSPGIPHLMLAKSLQVTELAALSRPVAGVSKDKALIVGLPGSPKAVTENLQAIIGILPHALDLIEEKQTSRQLHSHNHATHGHSHDHSHGHSHSHSHGHGGHHGPKFHSLATSSQNRSIPSRPRKSPYPMIPVEEAQTIILEQSTTPEVITKHITSKDFVSHVLAKDITAQINVPHYRASIVDGYAVVHTDCPGNLELVSVSHASPENSLPTVISGTTARVTTGAPIPDGATAIIPVEETEILELTDDGSEEKIIQVLAQNVSENDNIRQIGSDVKKGTRILMEGTVVSNSGGEIGLLASVGVTKVQVYRKPVVGILSTGDELVDVAGNNAEKKTLSSGEIFDSNRPSLLSMVKDWGFEVVDLGIARDNADSLKSQIERAYSENGLDCIITTGGVSMGELDLLKPTIESGLGGKLHFGRVAMKPGKPTTFGTFDIESKRKLIFALPGNPASASVTFLLFVLPALRKVAGYADRSLLPKVDVQIQSEVKLDPRPEYHRVQITQSRTLNYDEGTPKLVASSTGFQRSSAISSMQGANGLLCLPSSESVGVKQLQANSYVEAIIIGSFY